MTKQMSKLKPTGRKGLAALLAVCRGLNFEPHDLARQLDQHGHYDLPLEKEFPFNIRLLRCESGHFTPILNWHERLELVVPLDGPARMRMGEQVVKLNVGDLLVVDNLKLHNLEDFPGFNARFISLSFLPELIYTPGSPACDYTFLLPFQAKLEGHPHVLRLDDEPAGPTLLALAELVERYFRSKRSPYSQAGCKASLLQLLYWLTRRFQTSEMLHSEFVRHQQQADRLARLFEHIRQHYAEPIRVNQAMQMVFMSQSQFMKVFKCVTGITFVTHLTRVRIANALRLLRESDATIADIAAQVGFSDQSYFDRRFREAYGKSPSQYRKDLASFAGRRADYLAGFSKT
jgi:AraC-like DNA-binding protein